MTEQYPATLAPNLSGAGLAQKHQELERAFRRAGLVVANSRFASALELSLSGNSTDQSDRPLAGDDQIDRFEDGVIISRKVPGSGRYSEFRYFLDGSQFTYPFYRVKHIPIYQTISAAAILHRDRSGASRILPGSLRVCRSWILPTRDVPEDLEGVLRILHNYGEQVVDPISLNVQPENYVRALLDYGEIERLSYLTAGQLRRAMEQELLTWWESQRNDEGWIVVDGPLRSAIPNAIGLVKWISQQYLTGEESNHLFDLRAGFRTSAFAPVSRRAYTQPNRSSNERERILWYLRMRDAEGQDARHGLIRLEASGDRYDSDFIDQVSSWILSERAPRATSDERSDTLLYPIHLLERMLKRHIASETRGWPGAR